MYTSTPTISIIAAVSRDNIIAVDGGMPWNCKSDTAHFQVTTMGKPIIMGRRTFDTIGKPLPGRQNIVMTRSPVAKHPGVFYANTPEQALEIAGNVPEIMIIGGAEIYAMFMPLVTRIYLSTIDMSVLPRAQPGVFYPSNPRQIELSDESDESSESSSESSESSDDTIYTYMPMHATTDAIPWITREQTEFQRVAGDDYAWTLTILERAR